MNLALQYHVASNIRLAYLMILLASKMKHYIRRNDYNNYYGSNHNDNPRIDDNNYYAWNDNNNHYGYNIKLVYRNNDNNYYVRNDDNNYYGNNIRRYVVRFIHQIRLYNIAHSQIQTDGECILLL